LSSWWYPIDVPLVLASRSPRRKAILEQVRIPFEQIPSGIEEEFLSGDPSEVVEHWAKMKAEDVSAEHPCNPVLGADTMVVLDNRLLGKPESPAEAVSMLKALRGKWHTVFGGVALEWKEEGISFSFSERTRVKFRDLTDPEIEAYVETGEPLDKAGAYGIQDFGSILVEKVDGCYFNVMGLPIARFVEIFRSRLVDAGLARADEGVLKEVENG